jgi:hypothetical protein
MRVPYFDVKEPEDIVRPTDWAPVVMVQTTDTEIWNVAWTVMVPLGQVQSALM